MSISKFKIKEINKLKNTYEITPSFTNDARGYIYTSYINNYLKKIIPNNLTFKHDKFSYSTKNVLRGLHCDKKSWKLVTCVYGEVFQVVVNFDKNSDAYLQHKTFRLSNVNKKILLLPPNYLNGFYVLSKEAVYHYKLAYKGNYIDSKNQITAKWDDHKFNINWPTKKPILSQRDK